MIFYTRNRAVAKYIFCICTILLFIACKKDSKKDSDPVSQTNTQQPTTANTLTINSPPQVTYEIDGHTYTSLSQFALADSSNYYGPASSIDSITYNVNALSFFELNIGKVKTIPGSIPDSSSFMNFFSNGSKTYGTIDVNGCNGVLMSFYDQDVSSPLITNYVTQAGSIFNIDEVVQDQVNGTQRVKMKISFSCMAATGVGVNVKSINNGTLICYIRND